MKELSIKEITVNDPDFDTPVELSVFKHENGGMFAIDSSYIEQVLSEEDSVYINDPLESNGEVELTGI